MASDRIPPYTGAFGHHDLRPLLLVLVVFLGYTSLFFGIVQLDPDQGRDFVTADLLREGKTLYRDVFYLFGPLAPWVNAALFRLFGASVGVLLLAGTLIGLAVVVLAYFLSRQFLRPSLAAVAASIVVAHAAYGFNTFCYAVPYTFAATYGLLFSLATLYSGLRAFDQAYSRWDFAAGVCAALALACKQEFALISLLTVATGLAFRFHRFRLAVFPAFLASAGSYCAVGATFATLLFRQVTLKEFLANVLPAQAPVWRHFYENTQYWGPNVWTGIRESSVGFLLNFAFVLWASCLLAWFLSLASGRRASGKFMAVLAAASPLFVLETRYLWYYPVLLHVILIAFALAGRVAGSRSKSAFFALSAAFFLMRVLPRPSTQGYYGLLYFVPSLIVYLYLCFELAPPLLNRFFAERHLQNAMAVVFLVCFGLPHFFVVNGWAQRTEQILTERGRIRVEREEAAKARMVLEEIRHYSSPGDKILLLPHGAMYYFVSDRRPASRYQQYIYGQLPEGDAEQEEIARLLQTPPKLVVIDDFPQGLHIPGSVNTFGVAYNRRLYHWIVQNYHEVRTIRYQNRQVHFLIPIRLDLKDVVAGHF